MAFGDLMISGSYSNLHNLSYCKHSKSISFKVVVYEDSNKYSVINELFFELPGHLVLTNVIDKDLSDPPTTPSGGNSYIVNPAGTGDWIGLDNQVVVYDDTASGIWYTMSEEFVYVSDEDTYYKNISGTWAEQSNYFDEIRWNGYFTIDKISEGNSSNLLKQTYVYLKTRPEFANITDI